jgi:hypothetical protein
MLFDPHGTSLCERVANNPDLPARRLLREPRGLGDVARFRQLTKFLRNVGTAC